MAVQGLDQHQPRRALVRLSRACQPTASGLAQKLPAGRPVGVDPPVTLVGLPLLAPRLAEQVIKPCNTASNA
jgi:hypothetical protein